MISLHASNPKAVFATHRPILRLRNKQIDYHGLHGTPHAEHDIRLPADILQRNREAKLVDESTGCNEEIRKRHALGPHLETENLDWIQGLHGRPAEAEADLEEVLFQPRISILPE